MFFFGENLQPKHKATLCLVMLAIVSNLIVLYILDIPFVQKRSFLFWKKDLLIHWPHLLLIFATFVQMLVLCIFRKF